MIMQPGCGDPRRYASAHGDHNSIAVCGLTGGLAIVLWRGADRGPAWTVPALIIWCAALVATVSPYAAVVAIVVGAVTAGVASAAAGRGVALGRPVAVAVLVIGVALAVLANIHGAALLVGLLIALPYRKAAVTARS